LDDGLFILLAFIRRAGAANGAENYAAEYDQSAEQGVGPHSFAEE
jgi:hypothetical protein